MQAGPVGQGRAGGSQQSLRDVIESAAGGDPACRRVLYEAGRYLGRALANLAKVMAPSVIAVGASCPRPAR